MNFCRADLIPIETGKYSTKGGKLLFRSSRFPETLPFTRSEFFTEGPKFVKGMSISGVQQKLSLKLNKSNQFEIVSTGGDFILKPSPESFPFAAENEQCAMAISRYLGIPTAYSGIIPFADGEFAYITRRYDRDGNQKLHQEDCAQGFGIPSSAKYDKTYEETFLLVRDMCGGKLAVIRDLFFRVLFAYLIGNDDMHLKNISLIRKPGNRTNHYDSLTPNYDQLFATSFENHSSIGFLALDLLQEETEGSYSEFYDKLGFYSGNDFMILAERVGLRRPVVESIIKTVREKMSGICDMIENSYMPEEMKKRAISVVKDRFKAIEIIS